MAERASRQSPGEWTPAQFRRVKELFEEALRQPESGRAAVLAEASDDPLVRAELERLLAAEAGESLVSGLEAEWGRALRSGAPTVKADDAAVDLEVPATVGRYRILRVVGEGGMGTVYEAVQSEPVERRVAVKVIKLGLDTRELIARFESERQALAMMDHPAIARVLDGGSTDEGRPYFAMEFVAGVPITDYCDSRSLELEERLELFIEVCRGVQHAHQKGVIHRDLKPSNVLVTEVDDRPVIKIIDFGLAKAMGRRLTDHTLHTVHGQFVGTPAYMSPEQLRSDLDVDTRTDVYSLGVLFYRLLVGEVPIKLRGSSDYLEMERRIREETPARPSRRLSDVHRRSPSSEKSGHFPSLSARRLRGDLDWISLKALEKDRTRRYQSVSDLAADVERHLSRQPVLAGPPGVRYRAERFVARHRVGVAVASSLVLILLASLGIVSWALARAIRAEKEASLEAHRAQEEADRAREVTEFLVGTFEAVDPSQSRGETVTAREVLDRGVARVREELEGRPRIRSELLLAIAKVYQNLGLVDEGSELVAESEALAEQHFGPDSLEMGSVLAHKADLLVLQGQLQEAVDTARRSLQIQQRHGAGDDAMAQSRAALGVALEAVGEHEEALDHLLAALEIERRLVAEPSIQVADLLRASGWVEHELGRDERAHELLEQSVALFERINPEHPRLAFALAALGDVLMAEEEYDQARAHFERSLAIREAVLPAGHPAVAYSLNELGNLHFFRGEYETAEQYYLRVLESHRIHFGDNHPRLVGALGNLALVNRALLRLSRSEALYREALEVGERVYGPDSIEIQNVTGNLGLLLWRMRRFEEASTFLDRALELSKVHLGADHPATLDRRLQRARLQLSRGLAEETEQPLRELLELADARASGNPRLSIEVRKCLADGARLSGADPETVIRLLEEALVLETKRKTASKIAELLLRLDLANALLYGGQRDRAEEHHRVAERLRESQQGTSWSEIALAEYWALSGDAGRAAEHLGLARDLGHYEWPPEQDPYLSSMHESSVYQQLVASYREPFVGAE